MISPHRDMCDLLTRVYWAQCNIHQPIIISIVPLKDDYIRQNDIKHKLTQKLRCLHVEPPPDPTGCLQARFLSTHEEKSLFNKKQ